MGARVDAAEGGAHPFLTAHFLTPPPVFVFNPRHSRRPRVHSLLVQKGGGACCSPLPVSRSFVRSFVTTSGTTSRSFPYFGREGRPRRLYSTRTQCSLSTSHTPAWCPCGSHEAQRDFDVRSSRDHPRKVRRPFMPRGSRHRPDIGTPTLFDASSFHHLLSICTSGRDNSSKKQFSFSSSFSFLSNQSNQKCDESSPPLRRFEAKIRARSGARVSKRGSVVIRVERQPAEGIRSRPFPSCPA